jgi:hypothetical protein
MFQQAAQVDSSTKLKPPPAAAQDNGFMRLISKVRWWFLLKGNQRCRTPTKADWQLDSSAV